MAVNGRIQQLALGSNSVDIDPTENEAMSVGADVSDSRGNTGGYKNSNGKTNAVRDGESGLGGKMTPFQADNRRRRVLLSTSTPFSETIIRSLFREPDIDLRLIAQEDQSQDSAGINVPFYEDIPDHEPRKICSSVRKWMNVTSARLADWADMLILAPADSGTLGSMIAGLTTTLTLTILRGWGTSKTILLVPGMTLGEWKAPITRRQLDEIRAYWPWVKILPPVFSRFEPPNALVEMAWEGREMFYQEIRKGLGCRFTNDKQVQKMAGVSNGTGPVVNGHRHSMTSNEDSETRTKEHSRKEGQLLQDGLGGRSPMGRSPDEPRLPSELLAMIFEHLGDWEVSAAVGVYTMIPMPNYWTPYFPTSESQTTHLSLEYTILRRPFSEIKEKLSATPSWTPLSNLATHLILRLCRTDILDFLCRSRSDVYWSSAHLSVLPFRASAVYGNTALLDWWLACSEIPVNDYLPDAVDSASRAGFTHILDWWRTSGLPLRYTERALESASAEGQTAVLGWWKRVSDNSPDYDPVPLKIGKSVLLAAQCGRTASLAWWDKSGIPFSYAEAVARIASTHGHVPVLDLWYQLKGPKMIFDNQVLVGATKNGHVDVLEWWRRSGLRVEFKTCDIEEALEDAVSGSEERVRRWWERNGLNLGVGTSEWMKVKVL